ncbi:hypothetical protein ACH4F6_38995 [Streptomyces sp. NPDC017936]|uniref:DUF7620 family protein n=1 Tax=Streptomyces sp. NPDC017936 TaxID=3365016 RepID=UPI0037BDEE49
MLARISRLLHRRPEPAERQQTPGQREASAALGRAEADRARLQAQRREVAAEAGAWRRRRRENHFAEKIEALFKGGEQWDT